MAPKTYIHVLDATTNITRVGVGGHTFSRTFIRQENKHVVLGRERMYLKVLLLIQALLCAEAVGRVWSPPGSREPPSSVRFTLYDRAAAPPGWAVGGRAATTVAVSFYVALAKVNVGAAQRLAAISDPYNHQAYGRYLSLQEIRAQFGAPVEAQRRVEAFFAMHGISCRNLNGAALRCTAPAKAIEVAFHTELRHFTHPRLAVRIVRHMGPLSLPRSLKPDIQFVSGLGHFPVPPANPQSVDADSTSNGGSGASDTVHSDGDTGVSGPASACAGLAVGDDWGGSCAVTPPLLRKLYNISDDAVGSASSSVGIVSFRGNYGVLDSDLVRFGADVAGNARPLTIDRRLGYPNMFNQTLKWPGLESTLDVQYAFSMANGCTNWVWNRGGWFYEWAVAAQNETELPAVVSLSYDWDESDVCNNPDYAHREPWESSPCVTLGLNSSDYVIRTNEELAKLALAGVTIVVSSGDAGAHSRTDQRCSSEKTRPVFPSTCPFVTVVGGTMLNDGVKTSRGALPTPKICEELKSSDSPCATGGREVVASFGRASSITSGGGFSGLEAGAYPEYQGPHVYRYLSNASVIETVGGQGNFNRHGRAYPDVAALGHQMVIILRNSYQIGDGTSYSAPIIAGIIGLINAHRLRQNRSVVGFINPLLYAAHKRTNGAAFNDITDGNNSCTENTCCATGFAAAPGWDAATGLGTPNLGLLLMAIDELDEQRERFGHG